MLSSFKLTQIQDLNSSCAALFNGLKDSVFKLIEQAENDEEMAVHEIRKKLKMIRAFLKMVKPGLPKDNYQACNFHYRNTGRMLSEIRDAHSRRLLLIQQEHELSDGDLTTLFDELKRANREKISALEQTYFVDFNVFERARNKLNMPESDFPVTESPITLETLIEGISETYQKGFNVFYTSRLCSSPELLHEWRKRVKDLQSQSLYIADVAGLAPHVDIDELNELAGQLGEIQDYNMTREWISETVLDSMAESDLEMLSGKLKLRQDKLLKTTEYLGKSIYRLEPERFKLQLQCLFR